MRKRTYTALVNDPNSIGGNDVLYTTDKRGNGSGNTEQTHRAVNNVSLEKGGLLPGSLSLNKCSTLDKDGLHNTSHALDMESAPLTTIHNLVGTCEIASSIMPIDLEYVYRCLPNSFYDRKRFAAITIRVTEPVCTGLLFTSGKLVITGCKTLIECVLASLKIVRMLERHIPTVTFLVRNAVVQNVVAHVVLPMKPGQRLNVGMTLGPLFHLCSMHDEYFVVQFLTPNNFHRCHVHGPGVQLYIPEEYVSRYFPQLSLCIIHYLCCDWNNPFSNFS